MAVYGMMFQTKNINKGENTRPIDQEKESRW